MSFKTIASDHGARCGQLTINGKQIQTPAFIPAAPLSQDKCLTPDELLTCKVQGLSVNLTDLLWRFGFKRLPKSMTLSSLLSWQGLLIARLGDSLSLARHTRNYKAKGLQLCSPIDGEKYWLSVEEYIDIIQQLSPDYAVSFHHQGPLKATKGITLKEKEQQLLNIHDGWSQLSQKAELPLITFIPLCFHQELQDEVIDSANRALTEGYAVANLAILMGKNAELGALQKSLVKLPVEKFRYYSDIARIDELIMAISCGADLIESTEPVKKANIGQLFTMNGEIRLSEKSAIKNSDQPIEPNCNCYTCKNFSREYLQYLHWNNIMLGQRLNAIHNIYFYQQLMLNIQNAIRQGSWRQFSLQLKGKGF